VCGGSFRFEGMMHLSQGTRIGAFFGALFLIYGVHLPFLPLWLEWRGLSPGDISIVVAAPYFLRVAVSPTVAFAADRTQQHHRFIIVLAFLSVAMAALLSRAHGFMGLLLAAIGLSLSMTTIMPLTEVIAVRAVRHQGCDYGRMRLWGSLTFILASFSGAWVIGQLGVGAVVWMVLIGCLLTGLASLFLPADKGPGKAAAVGVRGRLAGEEVPSLRIVLDLAGTPVFLLFLVACGASQAAHATYYAFGSIHWSQQGLRAELIGVLWAIGVIAEIGLFAVSGAVYRRITAPMLMVMGTAASVLRWCAMAFDPGLGLLVPLQLLHALTFGASHLAAIRFISEAVDVRLAGTAQALYATIAMGVAMGAATLLSGKFYAVLGGKTYLLMAAISAVGLIAAMGVMRLWSGGVAGAESQQR
jgi:MFS transporter, PPP family, 3-phenylpropionic acid transporter